MSHTIQFERPSQVTPAVGLYNGITPSPKFGEHKFCNAFLYILGSFWILKSYRQQRTVDKEEMTRYLEVMRSVTLPLQVIRYFRNDLSFHRSNRYHL